MRSILAATFALLASVAVQATPTRRNGCGSLSGTGNVANFTLKAVYTGVEPLIVSLALVKQTPSLLNSWIAVSSAETPMTMLNGAITVGSAVSEAVDTTNGLLDFISFTSIAPYPAYCSVSLIKPTPLVNTTIFGSLAVNGDAKGFSLCTASGFGTPQIVVYKPDASATRFDYSTCKGVNVILVSA